MRVPPRDKGLVPAWRRKEKHLLLLIMDTAIESVSSKVTGRGQSKIRHTTLDEDRTPERVEMRREGSAAMFRFHISHKTQLASCAPSVSYTRGYAAFRTLHGCASFHLKWSISMATDRPSEQEHDRWWWYDKPVSFDLKRTQRSEPSRSLPLPSPCLCARGEWQPTPWVKSVHLHEHLTIMEQHGDSNAHAPFLLSSLDQFETTPQYFKFWSYRTTSSFNNVTSTAEAI
jgi:hypothetical protein